MGNHQVRKFTAGNIVFKEGDVGDCAYLIENGEVLIFTHKDGVVERMRESIHALGGEIRFQCKVTDIDIDGGRVRGVRLANGETIAASAVSDSSNL